MNRSSQIWRLPCKILPVFLLIALSNLACCEDIQLASVHEIAYGDPMVKAQRLDIHHVTTHGSHPVVVWIHGGGWRGGDKDAVQFKPSLFNRKGFSFVSVDYRLHPEATVDEMASDVATAVAWIIKNAESNWIDPNRIVLAGHSAGAHLAALVATDHSYLKAEGVDPKRLVGCIPVDTAAYDIPQQIRTIAPRRRVLYTTIFTTDKATQQRFSPRTHLEPERSIPPFLILHVADRADSGKQSRAFADRLRHLDVACKVGAIEGKTHATINRDLGRSGDETTQEVTAFLDRVLRPPAESEEPDTEAAKSLSR